MSTLPAQYGYPGLTPETAMELRMSAERVRTHMKRSAEDIIAIGLELQRAKELLGHGQFGSWLQAEFEMSQPTAQNFMQVATRFGGKNVNFTNLSASALYLLASPSTPETVVEAVQSGEVAPNIAAIKEALAEAKEDAQIAARQRDDAQNTIEQMNSTIHRMNDELQKFKDRQALRSVAPKVKEVRVEVVPPEVEQQMEEMEQRINTLTAERDALATRTHHARAIEKWRASVAEFTANLTKTIQKAELDMPPTLDTSTLQPADWERINEARALLSRASVTIGRIITDIDSLQEANT